MEEDGSSARILTMAIKIEEDAQWLADSSRLMKIALRTHDPEMLDTVYQRISEKYGELVAENSIYQMITHLITTENWSWEDADGNSSPLLDHEFPE